MSEDIFILIFCGMILVGIVIFFIKDYKETKLQEKKDLLAYNIQRAKYGLEPIESWEEHYKSELERLNK